MNFFEKNTQCPIGNGGGTCKTMQDVEKLLLTDIEIIEIGSITKTPRLGNEGDVFHNGSNFTLNSLGLPNPGQKYYEENLPKMIDMIHEAGKKVIVNVVGFSAEEYTLLTRFGFECGADFVVENFGCPNIWVAGLQKGILSYDLDGLKKTTIEILIHNTKEAREGRIGIKFSPIFDSYHMANIASFLNSFIEVPVQDSIGYIGSITTQNTAPNCYDEDDCVPVISPGGGLSGMAGKAVFPMALGQVKQFRKLLNPLIKIIGVGGVTYGKDVQKMIRNGADFVQIVSAYYATEDPYVFNKIGAEYLELQMANK